MRYLPHGRAHGGRRWTLTSSAWRSSSRSRTPSRECSSRMRSRRAARCASSSGPSRSMIPPLSSWPATSRSGSRASSATRARSGSRSSGRPGRSSTRNSQRGRPRTGPAFSFVLSLMPPMSMDPPHEIRTRPPRFRGDPGDRGDGADEFRILFVADVVGRPGRAAVAAVLPGLQAELKPHLTIVNGENSAGGFGITAATARELIGVGADIITTGNHVWDQKQFVDEIAQVDRVLRPYNYPPGAPGMGAMAVEADGEDVLVMNLQGRIFLPDLDDPFRAADEVLAAHRGPRIVFCDMHAEATSEKAAMGWHLAGRASAVVGTHTHVATADARVLPGGTAYVTDV